MRKGTSPTGHCQRSRGRPKWVVVRLQRRSWAGLINRRCSPRWWQAALEQHGRMSSTRSHRASQPCGPPTTPPEPGRLGRPRQRSRSPATASRPQPVRASQRRQRAVLQRPLRAASANGMAVAALEVPAKAEAATGAGDGSRCCWCRAAWPRCWATGSCSGDRRRPRCSTAGGRPWRCVETGPGIWYLVRWHGQAARPLSIASAQPGRETCDVEVLSHS